MITKEGPQVALTSEMFELAEVVPLEDLASIALLLNQLKRQIQIIVGPPVNRKQIGALLATNSSH